MIFKSRLGCTFYRKSSREFREFGGVGFVVGKIFLCSGEERGARWTVARLGVGRVRRGWGF